MRHYTNRSILTESMRETAFTVYKEIHGLATQESTQHTEIIAIKNKQAYTGR